MLAKTDLFSGSLGAYLLFYAAFSKSRYLSAIQKIPDASYGFYLYGWPVGKLLILYLPRITPVTLVITTTLVAYAAGLVSWILIEKPAMTLKLIGLRNIIKKPASLPKHRQADK